MPRRLGALTSDQTKMINKTLTTKLKKIRKDLEAHDSSEGVVVVGKNFELYVHANGQKMKTTQFYSKVHQKVSDHFLLNADK